MDNLTQKCEKKMMKATKHHFNNLKILSKRQPSEKELEKMYSYLDNCLLCGEELTFLEPYSHGFEGNIHKFGCENYQRIFGIIFNFIKFTFIIIKFIPALKNYGIYKLFGGKQWVI